MLTNWTTIKTRADRLKELERREETGALDLLPKSFNATSEMTNLRNIWVALKQCEKYPT